MSLNYAFERDDVFPSFFANRVQDQISGLDSKLWLRIATTNTVEVVASADDGIVSLFVEGRWRFVTAAVQRVASGVAGWKSVWATARDTVIVSSPNPFTDNTDYSFQLGITVEGDTPAPVVGSVEIWTRIGRLYWDGTKIVHLQPLIGYRPRPAGELVPSAAVTDGIPDMPGRIKADFSLVNIADFPAIFGKIGHSANGGIDPGAGKFRLPDGRGRVFFGRGTNAMINTVGKTDALGVDDRGPAHTHVVAGHSHSLPDHTHSVPGHFHGRGTLAVSPAGIAYNWWNDPNAVGDPSGTFGFFNWFFTSTSGSTFGTHTHALTGVVGNAAGANGDATLTTTATSVASTGSASPATDTIALPYLTGTWMITTGE